jgi:hypothetical protein
MERCISNMSASVCCCAKRHRDGASARAVSEACGIEVGHSIQLSYERVGAGFTAVSAASPKD